MMTVEFLRNLLTICSLAFPDTPIQWTNTLGGNLNNSQVVTLGLSSADRERKACLKTLLACNDMACTVDYLKKISN